MILLFEVLAVLAVVFGVAAYVTGRAEGLSDEPQDLATVGIPRDRAMTPEDVTGLRFALALRGYRMDEVDDALDRLAAEISARDEAIARLRADLEAARTAAPDVPEAMDVPEPPVGTEHQAWTEEPEPAGDYVPSDATGEVAPGTPVDVPTTPEGWSALDPGTTVEADPDTPTFVEPPANPFRPEVPEIPVYDPWSVTPRSRYTEGPTYVEVEHHDDDVDPVEMVTEHQTGHAPAPVEATTVEDEPAEPDDEAPEAYRPPWQS